MNLISAISGLPDIPNKIKVESDLLLTLGEMIGQDKGLMKLFKKVIGSDEEIGVLKAAIPLLGRIGGKKSERFLNKLAKSHPQLSELIQKTLGKMH